MKSYDTPMTNSLMDRGR